MLIMLLEPIVDGSEILRSPVEVGSLSHYLRRWLALALGFLNHQQRQSRNLHGIGRFANVT